MLWVLSAYTRGQGSGRNAWSCEQSLHQWSISFSAQVLKMKCVLGLYLSLLSLDTSRDFSSRYFSITALHETHKKWMWSFGAVANRKEEKQTAKWNKYINQHKLLTVMQKPWRYTKWVQKIGEKSKTRCLTLWWHRSPESWAGWTSQSGWSCYSLKS